MLHDALFLFGPVTVFRGVAFVVALLALGQGNFGFHVYAFPVQGSAHAGVAFGLNLLLQPFQFPLVQQQFALPARFTHGVGGGLLQWRDKRASEVGLTAMEVHVGIQQLHFTLAQGFYFPAGEGEAGFKLFFNEVVVAGFFVQGDGAAIALGFFLVVMGASITEGYLKRQGG